VDLSRATELTAWQSDDEFCLTHGSSYWTRRSLQATAMGATVAHANGFVLSMPSPHDQQRVYFLCDILWPEVQSHSDDSPVHARGPCSACALEPYNVMHSSSFFPDWNVKHVGRVQMGGVTSNVLWCVHTVWKPHMCK